MAKEDEVQYASALREVDRIHARDKPYSDPECGRYLQEMGLVLGALPSPPARVLDMGCGTGWTTEIMARAGYQMVGVDIAAEMIDLARSVEARQGIEFFVADYETLPDLSHFDAVVFFDSLHHSDDERAALGAAFDALSPGGVVVLSEPGVGHHLTPESQRAVRDFGVTEKDMPPQLIIEHAMAVGFSRWKTRPYPFQILDDLDGALDAPTKPSPTGLRSRARETAKLVIAGATVRLLGGPSPAFSSNRAEFEYLRHLRATIADFETSGRGGITVLWKGA